MRLSPDSLIAASKLTEYLLSHKIKSDKSKWLQRAGYTLDKWRQLESDLRQQVLPLEAALDESNRYGDLYRIEADLTGPNGRSLSVVTIWMIEHATGETKFITMYPQKRKDHAL